MKMIYNMYNNINEKNKVPLAIYTTNQSAIPLLPVEQIALFIRKAIVANKKNLSIFNWVIIYEELISKRA